MMVSLHPDAVPMAVAQSAHFVAEEKQRSITPEP